MFYRLICRLIGHDLMIPRYQAAQRRKLAICSRCRVLRVSKAS